MASSESIRSSMRFTDADQDSSCEGEREFAGFFHGAKAQRRNFVGRFGMRQVAAHQARADSFEHQADAGVGIFQTRENFRVHHAWIRVRQQARAIEHEFAHRREIVERACETLLLKEIARFREDSLGLVAQRKQSFFAASAAALLGDG